MPSSLAVNLDSVTATRVVKSRNCFSSFFSNLAVLHVLGGVEHADFRILTALRCGLTRCPCVSVSWMGWNGRCKWIPISLSHCDLTKAETTTLPPGKVLLSNSVLDWTVLAGCTYCQRKLFAWGLLGGVTLQQVAFLTWVPGSQWSLTTQALLTTCLARLFTRGLTEWEKPESVLPSLI